MVRSSAARLGTLAVLTPLTLIGACAKAEPELERLQAPPGFVVELVTDALPNARQLQIAADGTLFAGTRSDGRVWAWRDGETYAVAEGLTMPSGIALKDGDLYVGAVDTIYRFDDVTARPGNLCTTRPALWRSAGVRGKARSRRRGGSRREDATQLRAPAERPAGRALAAASAALRRLPRQPALPARRALRLQPQLPAEGWTSCS